MLLAAAGLLCGGGCVSVETVGFCDSGAPDSASAAWSGRRYICRLFRKDGHVYLECRILESAVSVGMSVVRDLGKNVLLSKRGLYFEGGRLHIEYRDDTDRWCEASVPFGDLHGDRHISEMPPYRETPNQEFSAKYGVCGVLRKDEAAIEAFLPTLQELLRADDAEGISGMIIYPIKVYISGEDGTCLENRQDFLKYYPQIFTEARKRELLQLRNEDILCNYKGLMINRRMWFCHCRDGKVYIYSF